MRTDRPPLWRRPILVVVRSRSSWARAYTRRQLRLADEDLLSTEPLARHVDEAADAVERTPHVALADKHRQLRRELFTSVRAVERRLARSGAYELQRSGALGDEELERSLGYVEDEVRPGLVRVLDELEHPDRVEQLDASVAE
ncbi:hypothetical protein acdb102_35400 [Acidothermaceae bacterium B102]|nr:hypothetical protein acdb102_35400 [Acidothermaceae bacterium B102]